MRTPTLIICSLALAAMLPLEAADRGMPTRLPIELPPALEAEAAAEQVARLLASPEIAALHELGTHLEEQLPAIRERCYAEPTIITRPLIAVLTSDAWIAHRHRRGASFPLLIESGGAAEDPQRWVLVFRNGIEGPVPVEQMIPLIAQSWDQGPLLRPDWGAEREPFWTDDGDDSKPAGGTLEDFALLIAEGDGFVRIDPRAHAELYQQVPVGIELRSLLGQPITMTVDRGDTENVLRDLASMVGADVAVPDMPDSPAQISFAFTDIPALEAIHLLSEPARFYTVIRDGVFSDARGGNLFDDPEANMPPESVGVGWWQMYPEPDRGTIYAPRPETKAAGDDTERRHQAFQRAIDVAMGAPRHPPRVLFHGFRP